MRSSRKRQGFLTSSASLRRTAQLPAHPFSKAWSLSFLGRCNLSWEQKPPSGYAGSYLLGMAFIPLLLVHRSPWECRPTGGCTLTQPLALLLPLMFPPCFFYGIGCHPITTACLYLSPRRDMHRALRALGGDSAPGEVREVGGSLTYWTYPHPAHAYSPQVPGDAGNMVSGTANEEEWQAEQQTQ